MENCSEEEKPVLLSLMSCMKEEYKKLREMNPDISIFSDELYSREGFADYLIDGISNISSSISSIPIVAAATDVLAFLLF